MTKTPAERFSGRYFFTILEDEMKSAEIFATLSDSANFVANIPKKCRQVPTIMPVRGGYNIGISLPLEEIPLLGEMSA